MISEEEIKTFLEGNDPEEHIVAIEFDYASDCVFNIKEILGKGKEIRKEARKEVRNKTRNKARNKARNF